MNFAVLALFLALQESFGPASSEVQSLLIFTTATVDDQQIAELKLRWTKLGPSFESQFAGTLNGFDQQNFWTILLSRGEPDVLFGDIQKAIQADDRTKVIVGRPNGIIERIFLSPFCWRKGVTEQLAFVMCNGKLEFPIDERGWEIDEKVEVKEALMRRGDESVLQATRSVWIDLLPGVRLATASPLQKRANPQSHKKDGQKHAESSEEENGEDEEESGEKEENGVKKKNRSSEEKNEEEDDDDEEEEEHVIVLSEADQKRQCKYRLSCYEKNGIKVPEKQKERQSPLGGKLAPQKGEKSTLKEAAKMAVKKMEQKEAKGKLLRENYNKDGEKVLADFWSELERKNKCKYRKSCYQTGKLPEIQRSPLAEWLGGGGIREIDEEVEKDYEKKFEDMDDYERKVFCRYRRSCYQSGVRPETEDSVVWSMKDFDWWSKLAERQEDEEKEERNDDEEERMKTVGSIDGGGQQRLSKLECKYRRSCYETGELPESLRPAKKDATEEHAVNVLGGKKVPTSVKELKLFCKYRKSCYVASAEAAKLADDRMEEREETSNKTAKMLAVEEPRKSKANSEPPKKELRNHGPKREEDESIDEVKAVEKKANRKKPQKLGKSKKDEEGCTAKEEKNKVVEDEKKQLSIPSMGRLLRKRKTQIQQRPIEVKVANHDEKGKVEKQKERKHKKYTMQRIMEMEEMKAMAEEKKVKEEKANKERKNKKYIVEEVPKELPTKVWTKKKMEDKVEEKIEEERKEEEEEEEEDEVEGKEDENKTRVKPSKLQCRYRKSCYRSGIVPESASDTGWDWQTDLGLLALFANLLGEENKEERSANEEEMFSGWSGMSEKERMFRCKYRKSCYERMDRKATSAGDANGKMEKRPVVVKPALKKPVHQQKIKREEKEVWSSPRVVDLATKLQCKYRKSCYEESVGGVPKVMERMIDRSGRQSNGTAATDDGQCNPWRISCRQALGLPIREKAPIGPSGKKLCRKKRKAEGQH